MDNKDKKLIRFFEIVPGAVAWATMLFLFSCAIFAPTVLAVVLIVFIVQWALRALFLAYRLILGYVLYQREMKVDWSSELQKLPPLDSWRKIYHWVMVPTYKEDIEILRTTLDSIKNSDYPNDRIIVTLATEERDKERALEYSRLLTEEYKDVFFNFNTTMHPANIHGEVKGKGANITYSAKEILPMFKKWGIPVENVPVTTMDADNIMDKKYLPCLTYHYLTTPDPMHKSFQPLPMYFNNIWDVAMPMRLIAMSSSFWQMMVASRPSRLRNFSSHAQSLEALIATDFWSKETIVEDGHQFWRTYFAFHGNHQVVPIFVPIYQDAIQGANTWMTIKEQYLQKRRWSWGVSDIPYVWYHCIKDKKIHWFDRLANSLILFESHWSWSTAALILALFSWMPLVIHPEFRNSVAAFNFQRSYTQIMIITWVGMLTTLTISTLVLPKRRKHRGATTRFVLDWILTPLMTPITSIFFSSIPAFDSQTRLMLGKKLEFRVTVKERTK